jgi:two-component sensor histidine kinase
MASVQSAYQQRSDIALYSLWAAFCSLLIAVAVMDHIHDPGIRWWQPLLWEGSSILVGTVWLIDRRRNAWRYAQYLDRPLLWIGLQFRWLPLLAIVFIVVVFSIRHGVYALLDSVYTHDTWPRVFFYETIKLALFISLWLGVMFGLDSFAQWQAQREQLIASQKALAEAQLAQLKAQLRPHFLFNALNTISSLMHTNVEQADRLLARLGDFLRASLQAGDRNLVPLSEELRLLELYAQIMQERFGDRLTLTWDIDPAATQAAVPALCLQPLLENAFKHGVERSGRTEHVSITTKREDAILIISIRNTGSTLGEQRSGGIGVSNCRERLRVLYGDSASFELTEDNGTVEARLTLPFSVSHI